MHNPRLVVIGHKQHGKGTFCDIARNEYGISAQGTSLHAARVVYDKFKDTLGYSSVQECYEDRDNHRPLWFSELRDYCGDNPSRIIETILSDHSICEGPRHRVEFEAAKAKRGLWDLVIFIDASRRLPLEPATSMQLGEEDADIILSNNTDIITFTRRCRALLNQLYPNHPRKRW